MHNNIPVSRIAQSDQQLYVGCCVKVEFLDLFDILLNIHGKYLR